MSERVCPVCHNTDHEPDAKWCWVCGTGFPLSEPSAKLESNLKVLESRDSHE